MTQLAIGAVAGLAFTSWCGPVVAFIAAILGALAASALIRD